MKKYIILESWHNRCDNAEHELYAECKNENDVREILSSLKYKFQTEGLGDGFPSPHDYRLMSEMHDNIYSFWLEDLVEKENRNGPMSSEYRRIFHVIIEDTEHPKWDFVYEEEIHEEFRDFFQGVISDGSRMLFHRTHYTSNNNRICRVYASINEMVNDGQEELSYRWNAENNSILIDALNNLKDPNDYFGEGSPIRTLKFRNRDRTVNVSDIILKVGAFLHKTGDEGVIVFDHGSYEYSEDIPHLNIENERLPVLKVEIPQDGSKVVVTVLKNEKELLITILNDSSDNEELFESLDLYGLLSDAYYETDESWREGDFDTEFLNK